MGNGGMSATDTYFNGLTEAEYDKARKIEAELNAAANEGFTERCSLTFVMAVRQIRKILPTATVGGILDTAILGGLASMLRDLREQTELDRRNVGKPTVKKAKSGARLVR